jgi:hypothetical protein
MCERQRQILGDGCEAALHRLSTLGCYSPRANVEQGEDVVASDVDADDLEVIATIAVLVARFESRDGLW